MASISHCHFVVSWLFILSRKALLTEQRSNLNSDFYLWSVDGDARFGILNDKTTGLMERVGTLQKIFEIVNELEHVEKRSKPLGLIIAKNRNLQERAKVVETDTETLRKVKRKLYCRGDEIDAQCLYKLVQHPDVGVPGGKRDSNVPEDVIVEEDVIQEGQPEAAVLAFSERLELDFSDLKAALSLESEQ